MDPIMAPNKTLSRNPLKRIPRSFVPSGILRLASRASHLHRVLVLSLWTVSVCTNMLTAAGDESPSVLPHHGLPATLDPIDPMMLNGHMVMSTNRTGGTWPDLPVVRDLSQEKIASELGRLFAARGVEGTFLLYDMQTGESTGYRPDRWDSSYIPVSTFKIFNALVALETGVIASTETIIPWDSVQRSIPAWNRDHTLATGFRVSAVWLYQELARRIGTERMQAYLDSAGYGNRTMGGPIDMFWLNGGVRITPREQVKFLVKLYTNRLPFSQRTMSLVREIMIAERTKEYILRAKTGLSGVGATEVGWYVGYVERGRDVYFFATELDIRKDDDVRARVELSREILTYLGVL